MISFVWLLLQLNTFDPTCVKVLNYYTEIMNKTSLCIHTYSSCINSYSRTGLRFTPFFSELLLYPPVYLLQKRLSRLSQLFLATTMTVSHRLLPLPFVWVRTAEHRNFLHCQRFSAFSYTLHDIYISCVSCRLYLGLY